MYCLEFLFAKRSKSGINLARAALMTADRKPSKMTYAALKGALWSGVGQWGGAVIGLVAFIINARILGPSVIGTNAFAVSMVAFGNLVVAGVLVEALIQRKTLSDEERSAGFWISVPFGLLGIIVFPVIAMFVPGKVGEILPYCALAIPINALAAAPVAILMRELRFKVLSTVELIAITVSSTLGVGMALNGFGVYSLVFMELTRISLRCVGAYAVSSYRPQLKPNLQAIKSVGKFGVGGLLLSLVGTAQNQIPRLAIGYFLGEAALGVFALATRLFNVLSSLVLGPLGSVALSVTGRLQDELEALGLRWSVLSTTSWDDMYRTLQTYVKERDQWDGNVPANYRTNDNPPKLLGRWINRQRSAYTKKKLKKEFVDKLEAIGLRWSVHARTTIEPSPPVVSESSPDEQDS